MKSPIANQCGADVVALATAWCATSRILGTGPSGTRGYLQGEEDEVFEIAELGEIFIASVRGRLLGLRGIAEPPLLVVEGPLDGDHMLPPSFRGNPLARRVRVLRATAG